MLFFVDESFQTIGRTRVGALGAVAIPAEEYNHFCDLVYRAKRDLLGATELHQREIKGNDNFAKAQFARLSYGATSPMLDAVDALVHALVECGAVTYGIWTRKPELLTLHNTRATTRLTIPYIKLMHYFGHLVRFRGNGGRGILCLDQLGMKEDLHASCMIANYLSRSKGSAWLRYHLVQVPHYTHSAVSPGLQAADLMAYLTAHNADPDQRPELKSWREKFDQLAWYHHGRTGSGAPQIRQTTGEVVGLRWHTGTGFSVTSGLTP